MTADPTFSQPWPTSTVGAEFEIQLGKMLDAERNVGEPKIYLGNRSVQWGRIDVTAAGLVPLTVADQIRYRLRRGDLLVCEGGEVGRGSIWRDELPECYYQKALHRLRSKASFEPRLMLAFLEHWSTTGAFTNYVTQTSIAHLPQEKLALMPLPRIPPPEQEAIASALSAADRLIAALERLITKAKAIKQGMMQQLLTGKTRLPGFTDPWMNGPLKRFIPLQRGFDLPTSLVREGPYPVVYSNGVARHHAVAMVQGPGVVTGRSGTIGKVHYVRDDYWPHNTALWVTSFSRTDARFVYYFLTHVGLEHFSSGSGVPTLNRNDAHTFEIRMPADIEEQKAISNVLTDADDEIDALDRRLTKAKAIKQGMMQELLTGRTRLPMKQDTP